VVLFQFNVVEEHSSLSRALAALLLAAVAGCTLNRSGLSGVDNPPPSDGRVDQSTSADGPADLAGSAGGGGGGAGIGAGGGGFAGAGAAGGPGGAAGTGPGIDAGAAGSDAGDAAADMVDGSNLADRPGDLGGDRTVVDLAPEVVTCGASPLCDNNAVIVTLPGGRFTGTTTGASLDQGSCGGDRAPEAVFRLVLTEKSDVFATTHGTGFDTVLYMRSGCCGTEIVCNDDADNRNTSMISVRGLSAGTYDIFVDGRNNANQSGAFTIDIYATPFSALPADDCGSPVRIANQAVTGTTCGMDDDFAPSAGCLVPPATNSFDTVYYFVLDAPGAPLFNTCANTCIDTVLSIRDVCTTVASQRACNDNFCAPAAGVCPIGSLPTQSRTTATLTAGVHYLILDTHVIPGPTGCGAYTITPTGVPQ
jgi:hypothetical protein